MSSRNSAFLALVIGTAATLCAQVLSYGLVYPAGARHSKSPLALALLGGALGVGFAAWLSFGAYRRASLPAERFLALLSLVLSAFFLFVVLAGFGIPDLMLGVRD